MLSIADERSDLCCPIGQGTLAWQPILGEKSAKLAYTPSSFIELAFRLGLEYRNADARVNSGDDAAISCENLVNFGPVTPEL